MAQYTFGVGTLIGKRTDLTYQAPAFLGVLQDIQLDFDQSLKALIGQYKVAVDIAPGELKIAGKAKFARIQASTINNLFFGQVQTAGSGIDTAAGEIQTPSGPTFTVANALTFTEDLGVFYANGTALNPVVSAPPVGSYIPGAAGVGSYTINASDQGKQLLIYYNFTVNTLQQIVLTNQLMGIGPVFETVLSTPYAVAGVTKKFNLKLNACRSSKLSFPLKNQDYVIQEMDFQAFADANNQIGTWSLSE